MKMNNNPIVTGSIIFSLVKPIVAPLVRSCVHPSRFNARTISFAVIFLTCCQTGFVIAMAQLFL